MTSIPKCRTTITFSEQHVAAGEAMEVRHHPNTEIVALDATPVGPDIAYRYLVVTREESA